MGAYDQRAARVTAAGAVTDRPSRLHSFTWVGAAGAGTLTFTDGNGGATVATYDIPAGVTTSGQTFIAEDSGLKFHASIYCSVITAGVLVTVHYS